VEADISLKLGDSRFDASGQVQSKKIQKLVFRSALGANQISFLHSQDPLRSSAAQNIALRSAVLTPFQAPLNVGTGVVTFRWPWRGPERRERAS
jgi:hypothetical protein